MGLRSVTSEYFGLLDDDDVIYPNHVTLLMQLIKANDAGLAYSGAVRVWEEPTNKAPQSVGVSPDPAELAYFQPFDANRLVALDNFITSNSFIARSALINNLLDDPRLSVAEDLFLLLNFCQHTKFIFSHEVTCEFYWRHGATDNAVLVNRSDWANAFDRIKTMFWGQQFPATQMLGALAVLSEKQRLRDTIAGLQGTIAHMERSKFWKMREFWFRVKGWWA
jgi:hypothetical protein